MENELLRDRQLANVIAKDHFPVKWQQPFPSPFPYSSSPADTGVILYGNRGHIFFTVFHLTCQHSLQPGRKDASR